MYTEDNFFHYQKKECMHLPKLQAVTIYDGVIISGICLYLFISSIQL